MVDFSNCNKCLCLSLSSACSIISFSIVVDLLTYRDAERTAFSIINHYVRFVDREDDKPKSQWITNDDWAWFVGENREPIRLTTKPEPYTLKKRYIGYKDKLHQQ